MMKIRHMTLGDGVPKYCVPLIPTEPADLLIQAKNALVFRPDAFEWRADYIEGLAEDVMLSGLRALRACIGELPLILTIRHPSEGGRHPYAEEDRLSLYEKAAASGCVDMIDIELREDAASIRRLKPVLRQHGVRLILSHHDAADGSSVTRGAQAMRDVLQRELSLGADILKMSVYAERFADLSVFADALQQFRVEHTDCPPVIGVVSGERGMLVRIAAERFGVDMTFASVADSGQIRIDDLKRLRNILGLDKEG